MVATHEKLIVHVTLTDPADDYDRRVEFLGTKLRLARVGTAGDTAAAERLVDEWAGTADAIAVTGLHEARALGLNPDAEAFERLQRATARVPVTDGRALTAVVQEWAVRHVQASQPGYFSNARTVVLGNSNHAGAARILEEYTANIEYADPASWLEHLSHHGPRAPLGPVVGPVVDQAIGPVVRPIVGVAAAVAKLPGRVLPQSVTGPMVESAGLISHAAARRAARDADVVVASYPELVGFGLEDLAAKTLITSSISDERLTDLAARGVDLVVDVTPQPFPGITIVTAVLEAILLAIAGGRLTQDRLLSMLEESGVQPRLLYPNGPKRKSRFAFVIHPLSQQYFRNVEPLGAVSKVAPRRLMDGLEKAMAYAPPFVYSHVTGITSPTGAEAEGWLITVGGTPKELMAHSPEFTYSRLLAAAETAQKLGAQIMGLGAFTKVVGDAGITVAKQAPLPITTGNSYSASGALWAAHDALQRLGLAEIDKDGRMRGKTMVVGATGAIGSVCARLLALASDEVWLVSPETAKLLTLKADIERESPRAVLHVAATPTEALPEMDLIVTATSGAGKKVLDIEAVKPGAVITDVARPLDLSAEDVAKRPDVLVVESGEIELPGDVHMGNIGLPKGVAYACLAETVVLALEGRYETFTVGRNIEWEKVKEIYRLGLKHGMRLASISGVNGVFTDDDIDRIRNLALAARDRGLPTA